MIREIWENKVFSIRLLIITTLTLSILSAYPIKWLWNWLMPVIFNLPEISFWQAFGLNFLFSMFTGRAGFNYKETK